jgi:hypothetical protein
MYKNNFDFMDELDQFNQDHERHKRKYKLLLDEFQSGNYVYSGKTISDIKVKSKKRKVKMYRKDIDKEGKLF